MVDLYVLCELYNYLFNYLSILFGSRRAAAELNFKNHCHETIN